MVLAKVFSIQFRAAKIHEKCARVNAKNYTFQLDINWQYLFIYNEIMIRLTHYHRIGILVQRDHRK